jgi:hypothetical protein
MIQEAYEMVDLDHHHVPQTDSGDTTSPAEGSRALVTTVTVAEERPNVVVRPAAPFVAQLIATVTDSPQTRVLRRAEPGDAANAYDAKPATPVAPRHLSRFFL